MTTAGASGARAIGPLGTFDSTELEASYRARERAHDVRIIRIGAVIGVLANVLSGLVDDTFQPDPARRRVLLLARLLNCGVAALLFIGMPRLAAPRMRDRAHLGAAAAFALTSIPILLARPTSFAGPLAAGLLLIVAFTLVLPATFRHQLAAVACLLVSFVGARVAQGPAGQTALLSSTGLLIAGVALTLFVSLRLHRSKRELFLALHEQHTLRGDLERALAEIRTLRGVVPICAFCNKIRDSVGEWHRVETYVSRHTHAEFSHGFCPTCEETHYPETG